MKNDTTYWGILCRTCRELVAFDRCPYLSFGPGAASMRPGAILCGQRHNHVYFPNDFQFLPSAIPIADEVMERNREVYRTVNPTPPEFPEPSNPVEFEVPRDLGVYRSTRGFDARRETAQNPARYRWTDWAIKKAM